MAYSVTEASSSGTSINDLRLDAKGHAVNPEAFRRHILNDTIMMNQLLETDPKLAKAVQEDDDKELQEFLELRYRYTCHCRPVYRFHHMRDHLSGGSGDFIVEAHKKLRDAIYQKGIDDIMADSLKTAGFARLVRLYARIKVKGYTCKAYVQSGARSTMISKRCAEKYGLMWLVDQTYKRDDQS